MAKFGSKGGYPPKSARGAPGKPMGGGLPPAKPPSGGKGSGRKR
jgi:hypothetical protein